MVTPGDILNPDEMKQRLWELDRRGPIDGWPEVAGQALALVADNSETPVDEQALEDKIAYVGDVIRDIVERPDVPVVFFRKTDSYYRFDTIIPERSRPVRIDPVSLRELPNLITYVDQATKDIGATPGFHQKMPGSREIIARISDDTGTGISNWMGAGSRRADTSPDLAYDTASDTQGQIAVGGTDIAELFTSLRTESSPHNARLFGALFHIAWLADDFEAEIPVVESFEPEAQAVLQKISALDEATAVAITHATETRRVLAEISNDLDESGNLVAEYETNAALLARNTHTFSFVKGRPADLNAREVSFKTASERLVNTDSFLQGLIRQQREEQAGRDREKKLVRALIGLTDAK